MKAARPASLALAALLTAATFTRADSSLAPGDGTAGSATFLGPTPYLRAADSPFAPLSFAWFYRETWEDHALNTPGVSMAEPATQILSSQFGPGLVDSVDEDDGAVNGLNNDGADHYGDAVWSGDGFRFVFDPAVLGAYPTHVGIVWTDGSTSSGTVTFEAFDSTGASLGMIEGTHADDSITGEVAEDRFYGVTCADGISAIRISNGGPIEVDHLQYGRGPALALGSPFAYSANTGWINARPSAALGLRVHASFLSGRAHAANFGWIDFGDGTPAASSAFGPVYANTSTSDFGVNRDATGNLSGHAYGANIGWINFGWATPDDPRRPRTDLLTGRFLGFAYSANLGWIDLGAVGLRQDIVNFPDTDSDGIPDPWEGAHFGNLATAGALTDFDHDGVSDLDEYRAGTDPRNVDSPAPARPSTVSRLAHHLYATNAGWIDARPSARHGLRVGEYFLSGWLAAPNFGWIHVGDGSPANGHAYGNTAASPDDYGVNLDASGAFSGYAYGANIGWINFGWAAPNDPNQPRVDLTTGYFSGYVYSANIGWISFASSDLRTGPLDRPDTDADGMDDAWERENFSTIATAGPGTDFDHDGVTDASEYVSGTDPRDRADYFRIVSQTIVGDLTQITLEFTSSETRRYRVEYTSQLSAATWTDSPLGTFAPDAGARTVRSFTLPSPATARFFRAVAILPLAP